MYDKHDIYFFSRFIRDENGGGGCRREAQIVEALSFLTYKFFTTRDPCWHNKKKLHNSHLIFPILKRSSSFRKYWDHVYFNSVYRRVLIAKMWRGQVRANKHIKLAIVDDPIYFHPLVNKLYRCKIPIVGLCQNIESLSYSQVRSNQQSRLFRKEMELFKKCALVVSISREETFLFKNFNIRTVYFPYYPVKSIEERMLKVRQKRLATQAKEKNGLLLLGTAGNIVTLEGMRAVIDYWQRSNNWTEKEKLLVAGYGTTKSMQCNSCVNVDFLGEVSNEKLDDVLSSVKAMICYQEFGSGALTKISEMLIAGVPVLANTHAARSYYDMDNVIEFTGLDNLGNAIKELEEKSVTADARDKPSDAELLKRIEELL